MCTPIRFPDDELRRCTNVELLEKKPLRHYCLSPFINMPVL